MIYLRMSIIFILVPTDDRETTDSQPRQDRDTKISRPDRKSMIFLAYLKKKLYLCSAFCTEKTALTTSDNINYQELNT